MFAVSRYAAPFSSAGRKRAGLSRWLLSASLLVVACGRLPGPVLSRPSPDKRFDLPGVGTGLGLSVWRFRPGNSDWADLRVAELLLYRRSTFRARAGFEMRILARNREGALRMKTWTGQVDRIGDVLELLADRCFVFGKRDFTDRLVPLEGWTCDHLAMHFRVGASALERLPSTDSGPHDLADPRRAAQTDWLFLDRLEMLSSSAPASSPPVAFSSNLRGETGRLLQWVGQRLAGPENTRELPYVAPPAKYGDQTVPGGVLGEKDGAVYFGFEAERHLRPGDRLTILGPEGRPIGSSRVLHIVGDFVLVQEARAHAPLAGTEVSHLPRNWFD